MESLKLNRGRKVKVLSQRWKQLESGAAKTKEIPTAEGFLFFYFKNLILTGKKHCGKSRRYRNASAGPVSLETSLFPGALLCFLIKWQRFKKKEEKRRHIFKKQEKSSGIEVVFDREWSEKFAKGTKED